MGTPARNKPTETESSALLASLKATVAERRRLNAATMVRSLDSRRVFVELAGTRAWLALTVMGEMVAEREMPAAELLLALGPTPGFDDFAALLDE